MSIAYILMHGMYVVHAWYMKCMFCIIKWIFNSLHDGKVHLLFAYVHLFYVSCGSQGTYCSGFGGCRQEATAVETGCITDSKRLFHAEFQKLGFVGPIKDRWSISATVTFATFFSQPWCNFDPFQWRDLEHFIQCSEFRCFQNSKRLVCPSYNLWDFPGINSKTYSQKMLSDRTSWARGVGSKIWFSWATEATDTSLSLSSGASWIAYQSLLWLLQVFKTSLNHRMFEDVWSIWKSVKDL